MVECTRDSCSLDSVDNFVIEGWYSCCGSCWLRGALFHGYGWYVGEVCRLGGVRGWWFRWVVSLGADWIRIVCLGDLELLLTCTSAVNLKVCRFGSGLGQVFNFRGDLRVAWCRFKIRWCFGCLAHLVAMEGRGGV